jgi:hypothetical protein
MASGRLPFVLALDLPGPKASTEEKIGEGGSRFDLPDGHRKPNVGAPRIHGELLMLGFDVSERAISRWMRRAPRDPERAKRWLAFLRNHREAIAAMDFFTVPTMEQRDRQ